MTEDDFFSNFEDEDDAPSGGTSASAAKDVPPTSSVAKKEKLPRLPMSRGMVVTIVCLVVSAVIGIVCGILAGAMGDDLDWVVWQYLIGIGGGIAATLLLGTAIYWLDEKNKLEYHYPVVLLLIGISVLNFVLRCYYHTEGYGDEYKIIFICLGILLFGLSLFFCFHLIDPPWIVTMGIGCAFSLAFLISGWIIRPTLT